MTWSDFSLYFFGTDDYALVLVNFIYGCVGMFIMMLFDIMGRNKKATYSPDNFSLKYFYKDNITRFMLNFFIMLVCIRFTADFIKEPPTPKTSLLIGFLSDVIVLIVKKRKQKFKEDNEDSDKLTITQQSINTQSLEIEQTSAQ
jgi:hypothetical protein